MKVLDLHCEHLHVFEGWFASEEDFVAQCDKGMVECPVCGSAQITKKLSAPRLNLGAPRHEEQAPASASSAGVPTHATVAGGASPELIAAWMHLTRKIIANTTDVGTRFAEEARKMHYGEAQERAIRGQTTPDEARALIDEGIDVLPLPVPDYLKEPLQ